MNNVQVAVKVKVIYLNARFLFFVILGTLFFVDTNRAVNYLSMSVCARLLILSVVLKVAKVAILLVQ